MLIRLAAENFLSIHERQEISLVASALKDRKEGLLECDAVPGGYLLPFIVLYGANASGKSNVVQGLSFLRSVVLYSHARGEPDGGVPRLPFALSKHAKTQPTSFEIDFIVEGVRHNFGFSASDEAFVSEWMYFYPKNRKTLLYERSSPTEMKFGRELRGQNRVIQDLMRPNSLFISTATQNDHLRLSKIRNAIASINIDRVLAAGRTDINAAFGADDVDRRTIAFLRSIGTGVVDSRKIPREFTDETRQFQTDLLALFRKSFRIEEDDDFSPTFNNSDLELAHETLDGDPVYFALERESSGTRRLLVLMTSVFRSLDQGTPLILDEIDASLHTSIGEAIISLFANPTTNPKGAQLIATTHDTNLMRSKVVRRDQIWFCEKQPDGSTSIYPLTDIQTRQGDNIEKGYLQGRYGAVPYAGSIDHLFSGADEVWEDPI